MQDAMDFSWANARGFYEMVARDVEQGVLEWSNKELIMEMRMTHSRTNFPEKKETIKDTGRAPPAAAPAGMRACAAYQRRECEQARDHTPYTHTCAYCLRTCNLMCRHPEAACIRRVTDEAKNGKRRE